MGGKHYTQEEKDFIKDNIDKNYKVIRQMFFEKFARMITESGFDHFVDRYNLRHGKVGHNGDIERLNEARIISNAILRKEIGSTARRGPDGHIYIKLRNNNGRNNYENLARYVYKEKHQENLTSSDVIMHIDGDLNNCDVDNLIKVTRNQRLQLARQFGDIKDKELLRTALNILKLKSKINSKK